MTDPLQHAQPRAALHRLQQHTLTAGAADVVQSQRAQRRHVAAEPTWPPVEVISALTAICI